MKPTCCKDKVNYLKINDDFFKASSNLVDINDFYSKNIKVIN